MSISCSNNSLVSETADVTAKECEQRKKAASKKVKELQDKLRDAKATREKELKAAEADVKKSKERMDKSSKQMKEREQVFILVSPLSSSSGKFEQCKQQH